MRASFYNEAKLYVRTWLHKCERANNISFFKFQIVVEMLPSRYASNTDKWYFFRYIVAGAFLDDGIDVATIDFKAGLHLVRFATRWLAKSIDRVAKKEKEEKETTVIERGTLARVSTAALITDSARKLESNRASDGPLFSSRLKEYTKYVIETTRFPRCASSS